MDPLILFMWGLIAFGVVVLLVLLIGTRTPVGGVGSVRSRQ
jgi:hypothetical protein